MAVDREGYRQVWVPEHVFEEARTNGTGAIARQIGTGDCTTVFIGGQFRCTPGCPWYKRIFGGTCEYTSVVVDGGVGRLCYCTWGILEPIIGRTAPAGTRPAIGAILAGLVALLLLRRRGIL
jgi:hypothetical protein